MTGVWRKNKLSEISKISYGYTEKATDKPVGPKFLRITDIQNDKVDWENVPYCVIDEIDFQNHQLKSGDLVFARTGATTGKSYLVTNPPKAVAASYLIRLRINEEQLLPEFLCYYFQSDEYWQNIKKGISGSAQGGFNASKLADITFSWPPLPEQQRIVALLDQAFAAINTAKANAEKNLQNARELFETCLQKTFQETCRNFLKRKIKEVCKIIGGGTPAKNNPSFYVGNILWATVRDMNSEVIVDTEFKINDDAIKNSSTNVIPRGNIIIATRVGLGKVCLLDKDTAINQDLKGILPNNKEELSIPFLFYWFKSKAKLIIDHGTGATVQGVKLDYINSLTIPLPPPEKQLELVKKLDDLKKNVNQLEVTYQTQLSQFDLLKKSILHKAFAGDFTEG